MAKSDAPRTPPGWEGFTGTLIRIANADESAVAWLVPEYGGNCAALMVRTDGEWVPLLHNIGPEALAERRTRFGFPILFPFPGHMIDFRYRWHGKTHEVPRRGSTAPSFTHGFAHTHAWQVTDVAPDRATLTFSTAMLAPDQRAAYPFDIRVTETVSLSGDALRISLRATNEGTEAAPVGLGAHPYFAMDALGGDRTQVRVHLPGRLEHIVGTPPVPTGEKRPVTTPDFAVQTLGDAGLVARTDLEPHAVATLSGGRRGNSIAFAFIEGVRDVIYFTPLDQPSISIEPHTCAPGAASQPEGHPDGLVPLDPGARRTMTVEVALRTPRTAR
jgi:aldose 1-epimerase